MKKTIWRFFVLCIPALYCSCSDDDTTTSEEEAASIDVEDVDGFITADFFNSDALLSISVVSATMEDNTVGNCYQIVFSGNGVNGDAGPFCPSTIDEIGGLAIYDGQTNPGLRNIAADMLNDLEADGWDIMDDDGTVHVVENLFNNSNTGSACLALTYDPDLTFTYLIPVEPTLASVVNPIGEIESIGVSIDGTLLTGTPPSAVNGPITMPNTSDEISFPSLDPCGGHSDPAGYYHAHFIPQVMDQVLEAHGITEVNCTLFEQTTSVALAGFAKDGYPVYAYAEMPTDLDECNGRTAATDEFPDGIYHYVASTTDAPNMPPCLKGVAAAQTFQYQ